MKMGCPLLVVRDMERAKRFYRDLLGMEVTGDFGANVVLSDRLSVQTLGSWKTFIRDEAEIRFGGNDAELYFEEADLDGFLERLAAYPDIEYVHPPKEHSWGQRAVRLYDPDRHIIEVGEEMTAVTRRFFDSGLTPEQVAVRMGVPVKTVRRWLNE